MHKPRTGINKNCLHCGKQFYVRRHRFETAKYCSMKCKGLFVRVRLVRACGVCGKVFDHISARCNTAKYCSRLCYHRSQKGRGSKEYVCKFCKIHFMSAPSKAHKYCSKRCAGLDQRAPESYANFADVREALILRGCVQRCDICNYHASKEILGIHHKDGNRKNNERKNLQVLCPNCHSLVHRKHVVH